MDRDEHGNRSMLSSSPRHQPALTGKMIDDVVVCVNNTNRSRGEAGPWLRSRVTWQEAQLTQVEFSPVSLMSSPHLALPGMIPQRLDITVSHMDYAVVL